MYINGIEVGVVKELKYTTGIKDFQNIPSRVVPVTGESWGKMMDAMIEHSDSLKRQTVVRAKLYIPRETQEALKSSLVYLEDLKVLANTPHWKYSPRKINIVELSLVQKQGLYKVRCHFKGKFRYWFYHGTTLLFKSDNLTPCIGFKERMIQDMSPHRASQPEFNSD